MFDSTDILTQAKVDASKDEHGSSAIYQTIAGAMVPYIQVVPEPKG